MASVMGNLNNYTLPQNWGQYLGDGTENGGQRSADMWNNDQANQTLKWLQQYDPNASIQNTQMSNDGSAGYYMKYDQSLLPKNVTGGSGTSGISNLSGLQDQQYYMGPRQQDSTYGEVGNSAATNAWKEPTSMVDILGPLAVGGLTMGAGLLGGFGTGMFSGLNSGMNMVRGLGSGQGINPMSGATGFLSAIRNFGGGGG